MTTDLILGGLTVSPDSGGRLHFWGEVYNLSTITQRWVRLTIRLLDAKDVPLMEQTDMLALEWSLPGMRNPFHIVFDEPAQGWKGYDMRLAARIHEYGDSNVPQPQMQLEVEGARLRKVDRGGLVCELTGQVVNRGDEPAGQVKVAGALYGSDGTVVGVESPYVHLEQPLQPGECEPFGLKFYRVGDEPCEFRVWTQGRKLD